MIPYVALNATETRSLSTLVRTPVHHYDSTVYVTMDDPMLLQEHETLNRSQNRDAE